MPASPMSSRGQLRQVLIDRRQAEPRSATICCLGRDARLVQIPVSLAARLPAAGADGLVEGRDLRHAGHLKILAILPLLFYQNFLQKSQDIEFLKAEAAV